MVGVETPRYVAVEWDGAFFCVPAADEPCVPLLVGREIRFAGGVLAFRAFVLRARSTELRPEQPRESASVAHTHPSNAGQ